MIIIPEAETVVILTPRAGSTALKQMLMHNRMYPQAFMPYRHMEADGVPAGYEHYRKVGMVRKPLARLWSVYNFLLRAVDNPKPKWNKFSMDAHRGDVEGGFENWLFYGAQAFATSRGANNAVDPRYHTLHPKPEQQKSQYEYLRPDLGTHVYNFGDMQLVRDIAVRAGYRPEDALVINGKVNAASPEALPAEVRDLFDMIANTDLDRLLHSVLVGEPLPDGASQHSRLHRTHAWDAEAAGGWY